jgi:hypothetical protein
VDRRDSTDDFAALPRKEELDCAVFVERVLRGIDQLVHIPPQRRNPEWIVLVKSERQIDEFLLIARRSYRIDAKRPRSRAQIRSMSRPTRRNASSTKSSCDSVWVAM